MAAGQVGFVLRGSPDLPGSFRARIRPTHRLLCVGGDREKCRDASSLYPVCLQELAPSCHVDTRLSSSSIAGSLAITGCRQPQVTMEVPIRPNPRTALYACFGYKLLLLPKRLNGVFTALPACLLDGVRKENPAAGLLRIDHCQRRYPAGRESVSGRIAAKDTDTTPA